MCLENVQRGFPLNFPDLIFSSGWMVTPARGRVIDPDVRGAEMRALAPSIEWNFISSS